MPSISGPTNFKTTDLPVTFSASGFSDVYNVEWSFDCEGWNINDSYAELVNGVPRFVLKDVPPWSDKTYNFTLTAWSGSERATLKGVVNYVEPVSVPVTSITFNPSSLRIQRGQKAYSNVTITPSNYTDNITEKLVGDFGKITTGGRVKYEVYTYVETEVTKGYCTFTADSGVSGRLDIEVVEEHYVESITLSGPTSINSSGLYIYTANILPTNATRRSVTFSISGDTSGAGINDQDSTSATIRISSGKSGTFTLKAVARDGSGVSASIKVTYNTVTPDPEPEPTGYWLVEGVQASNVVVPEGGSVSVQCVLPSGHKWSVTQIPNATYATIGSWLDTSTMITGKYAPPGKTADAGWLVVRDTTAGKDYRLGVDVKSKYSADYSIFSAYDDAGLSPTGGECVTTTEPLVYTELFVIASPEGVDWTYEITSGKDALEFIHLSGTKYIKFRGKKKGSATVRLYIVDETDPKKWYDTYYEDLNITIESGPFINMLIDGAQHDTYPLKNGLSKTIQVKKYPTNASYILECNPEQGMLLSTNDGSGYTLTTNKTSFLAMMLSPGIVKLRATLLDSKTNEKTEHYDEIEFNGVEMLQAPTYIRINDSKGHYVNSTTVALGAISETFTVTTMPTNVIDRSVKITAPTGLTVNSTATNYGATFTLKGVKRGKYTLKAASVAAPDVYKEIEVRVFEPANPSKGMSYIGVAMNGTSELLYLPDIQSVEDIDSVNLTELPTMVYGFENTFVMDTGTQKRFNIAFYRVNPDPYDDSSNDQEKWSNGKWYTRLKDLMDFWQNFGEDIDTGERVGGFRLHLESEDTELYPTIDRNVFLTGTVNASFDVQRLSVQMPVTVARMKDEGNTAEKVTIVYHANLGGDTEYEQSYPKGIKVPIGVPKSSWTNQTSDGAFICWTSQPNGGGTRYYPGQRVAWTENTTLYAKWAVPIAIKVFSESGDFTDTVPEGASTASILLVGGGGSGARYAIILLTAIQTYQTPGGAGGSGDVYRGSCSVNPGDTFTGRVGAGGAVTSSATGNDGEDTTIDMGGSRVYTVKGGAGGSGATNKQYKFVAGGSYFNAGGDVVEKQGQNGHTGEPAGIVGRAAPADDTGGGAGGGAASLNSVYRVGGQVYSFVSRGGGGGNRDIEPTDGVFGGGGGSNSYGPPSAGGDGLVVVLFFA